VPQEESSPTCDRSRKIVSHNLRTLEIVKMERTIKKTNADSLDRDEQREDRIIDTKIGLFQEGKGVRGKWEKANSSTGDVQTKRHKTKEKQDLKRYGKTRSRTLSFKTVEAERREWE